MYQFGINVISWWWKIGEGIKNEDYEADIPRVLSVIKKLVLCSNCDMHNWQLYLVSATCHL